MTKAIQCLKTRKKAKKIAMKIKNNGSGFVRKDIADILFRWGFMVAKNPEHDGTYFVVSVDI